MNNKPRHSIANKLIIAIVVFTILMTLVVIGVQLYFQFQPLRDQVWLILLNDGIKTVLVATFIYFIVNRLITRHLNKIIEFVRQKNTYQTDDKLQLDRKNDITSVDELDALVSAINKTHISPQDAIDERISQEGPSLRSQNTGDLEEIAGNIAHDYNNLLGIIKGYAEQLNNQLIDEPKLAKYAQEISNAVERATKLNEKLLNISQCDEQNTFSQNDQYTAAHTPNTATALNPRGGETLLVVDDEPSLATMAREMLSSQGYRVLTANSGEQALEILEKAAIALMVSDVVMPQMNGYQLAATVQQKYPHIKILMVSGINDHHKSAAGDLYPQNMLLKPYELKTLLEQVRNLLDDKYSSDEKYSQKNLDHCSILVMDDEEDVRELFSLRLAKLGCKTIPASNGEQAIELYRKSLDDGRCIDAIIMDLSIPGGLNGKDVAEKIRTLDPDARIIVASGHSDSKEMTHYQNYGFQGALEKDFDQIKIKQVLKHVLSIN